MVKKFEDFIKGEQFDYEKYTAHKYIFMDIIDWTSTHQSKIIQNAQNIITNIKQP